MLTCRQFPDALEKEPKTLKDKVGLRFHMFLCQRCRALAQQYRALSHGIRRFVHQAPAPNPELVKKILDDFKNKK